MDTFNIDVWKQTRDESIIKWLCKELIKGANKEHLTENEVKFLYNDFIKPKLLYHEPEDSEMIEVIIDTFNYLNK